jgi:predicted N-acetyltransferase YhbS
VHPERRGDGVGRRLMSVLETMARHAGYTRVRLRTDSAARFYEKLGYDAIAEETATHQRLV